MRCSKVFSLAIVFLFTVSFSAFSQSPVGPIQAKKSKTGNSAAVNALIKAEQKIYSPLNNGLKTLSFDMPVKFPSMTLGHISYHFQAPNKANFKVHFKERIDKAGPVKASFLANKYVRLWDDIGRQLGRPLFFFLDQCMVTFAEEGKENRILLTPLKGTELAKSTKEILCAINAEGFIESISKTPLRGGPETRKYTYKKYKESDLSLVETVVKQVESFLGKQEIRQTYCYHEIGGIPLVKYFSIKINNDESKFGYTNFKVNEEIDPAAFKDENTDEKDVGGGNRDSAVDSAGGDS